MTGFVWSQPTSVCRQTAGTSLLEAVVAAAVETGELLTEAVVDVL